MSQHRIRWEDEGMVGVDCYAKMVPNPTHSTLAGVPKERPSDGGFVSRDDGGKGRCIACGMPLRLSWNVTLTESPLDPRGPTPEEK